MAIFNSYVTLPEATKAGFSVVDTPGGSRAPWDRLLLPCVGPEVWRQAVPDATQAVPRPSKGTEEGEQKLDGSIPINTIF